MNFLETKLEEFDEKFNPIWAKSAATLLDITNNELAFSYIALNAPFWKDDIKSFISDFYRQILTEDIERLEKLLLKENRTWDLDAEIDEKTWNRLLSSEITHKKQLLKELE